MSVSVDAYSGLSKRIKSVYKSVYFCRRCLLPTQGPSTKLQQCLSLPPPAPNISQQRPEADRKHHHHHRPTSQTIYQKLFCKQYSPVLPDISALSSGLDHLIRKNLCMCSEGGGEFHNSIIKTEMFKYVRS